MSPLYLAAILLTSALVPPSLGQGYGPLPHKGKKHRTTTTTVLPPDVANLNLGGQQYQPGYNPVSSTPIPDNSLGSYNPSEAPPQGGGSFWWQNPNSPFNGANAPGPSQPGGCGTGGAGGCGAGSTPINIEGNPFLSGLKPGGGAPVTPSGQTVACSGAGYICAPKHLCSNGVVIEDGQGLFQVRAEVQYCDAASQVCCRLPSGPNSPSGGSCGYGSGGSCGGNRPTFGSPSQPGLIHVTPTPGSPSQPGLIHVTPTPGGPSQPGLIHVTPTPGGPSQPGLVHVAPSQPPSGGHINAGAGRGPTSLRPPFPSSGAQYPSASIPSATYTPGNNYNYGQPAPGTNGVPIGGSIYDTTGRPVTQASNQSPYTGPLNTTPHPGCAAALKCVSESYCTAEGVMADRPVSLTREQYENRVPLSECADPDTGAIGKCCRDPNYKDPWPGGMMMMNNGGGQHQHQPDECGAGASCVHSYQCGNQYKIQPTKGCRVPLDGASGVCCSNDQSAFPSGQPSGTFFPGTTPIPQKPHKKPTTGYPQPKPGVQQFPQQVPQHIPSPQPFPSSQPFPQQVPSSPQPFPQQKPSYPTYPQSVPSPQPSQPVPSAHPPTYPKPVIPISPQPQYPVPQPTQPQPQFPQQPHPSQPQPQFPQQPQPQFPQQPHPSQPKPQFPQQPQPQFPQQPYPHPSQPQPQFPQQPQPQFPQQPQPQFPQQPHPQPHQPQPQFPQQPQPQFPQQPHPSQPQFPQPQPQPTQVLPQFPSQQPTGYPQPGIVSPKPGAECGIRRQVSRQGLTDVDAGFGEFPWQALVLSNTNHSALCSAAIISDRAVVTAAHCLHNVESSDVLVQAGVWKLNSNSQPKPAQLVPVAAIARHPSFDAGSLFNDLAVLVLGEPLRFDQHIDKICLPPKGQDATQYQRTCTATGWGKKALQGNIPGSILHQVPVRLISNPVCEDTLRQTNLGRYFILNQSFQCAVPTAPSQDLCKVDVGGPIACDRGDGHHELSGLYSWDVGCNAPSAPTVFGGIDVAWIESVLARPVNELVKDELNEVLKQQQQQDLGNVDTESKPGFSQGYGKK